MGTDVSMVAAFAAGVLSFSSPCVLPLVPVYLAHLAGVSVDETSEPGRRRVMGNAVAYVAGFSVVFVLLGLALGAAGTLAASASFVAGYRFWLVRVGGALLILLGLHQLRLITVPFLDRERRPLTPRLPSGRVASSFVVGVGFGAGWSPCVGPILGAILTMAAVQGNPLQSTLLLALYAAGMSVPFLLAAAFGSAPAVIRHINRRLHMVSSLSGAVMLGMGAIMLLGIYQGLFTRLVALAPWTPWEPSL